MGWVRIKDKFAEAKANKIFETNSSFPVKQRATVKV